MQEHQANWMPRPLNIMPGNTAQFRTRKQYQSKSAISRWTIIGFIALGMFLGYILGLWQQAAQKAHRENCSDRRAYAEE